MTRIQINLLLTLILAVPAATAGSLFTSSARPCFIAGNAAYEMASSASADYTVRVDAAAESPNLRMQLVDDPAAADFVLVDDGDMHNACQAATAINSIHLDPAASNADMTVALSRAEAGYKIYVSSANFSAQDAAALFAVILQNTRTTHAGHRAVAERD